MRFLRIAAAALVMLCSLTFASMASAREMPAPGQFRVPASNGYTLSVSASEPLFGFPSMVALSASRGEASATYVVAGHVTPTGIEADLGALGRIAVAYRVTGGEVSRKQGCGPRIAYPAGVYEGTIEFHGEDGYAVASASSAKGGLPASPCAVYSIRSGPRIAAAHLQVGDGDPWAGNGVYFEAMKDGPNAKTLFRAAVTEAVGDIGVTREVMIGGAASAFLYPRSLRTATVSPPPPFSGAATFKRGVARRNFWSGDLSVDFPGRADVPLTGERTQSSLEHEQVRIFER